MPRRAATVTQADIARAIRAVQAAGLQVMRVVVRPDGVAVETVEQEAERTRYEAQPDLADEGRVVIL